MNYIEHIESALVFIENNLKTEVSLADLARAAGYSEYHFLRIFKEVVGLTPGDYIRKRRLSEIAREMENGSRSASEIAYEYGFNSKENFTRAFKAEHRVLPTEHRSSGNSLKLYSRFDTNTEVFGLEPKIITLSDFTLVGYYSDEEYTSNFWNKYNCRKLSEKLSGGETTADYGVCTPNGYFIGIKSAAAKGETADAARLFVSGGLYAVFSTPKATQYTFVTAIHRTWRYILNIWMPKSGYKCTTKHGFQYESYIESSRTFSEDIHIPIERK